MKTVFEFIETKNAVKLNHHTNSSFFKLICRAALLSLRDMGYISDRQLYYAEERLNND